MLKATTRSWPAILIVLGSGVLSTAGEEVPLASRTQGQTPAEDKEKEEEPKKSFWSSFKDPEDGKFDVTASGKGASGFLPLLIPFNEPAIGIGIAGALAYFHPSKEPPSAVGEPKIPPNISFGGGAYTENGTWAALVGYMGAWKKGRIRYKGILGYASANLDFYGVGNDPLNMDPVPFNIAGGGISQQVTFRLGDSRWFAGTSYAFASTDTTFDINGTVDEEGETNNAGLSALLNYDSRDTIFTPNKGTRLKFGFTYFDEVLGGDFNYSRQDLAGYKYWSIAKSWVLGLRLEYHHAGGGGPFYALPWVKLRGVPAFRYLGNYVVEGEIEPRFKIDERWSVLAFAGAGRAARNIDRLKDAERAYSYGTGFRYLLSRKLGLGAGLDIAWGPEDSTVYIIFGSYWGI